MKLKICLLTTILCFYLAAFTSETFVIGFSQCGQHENWRQNMEREMETELMFHEELSLVIKQAEDNSQLQIEQIKELVNMGVDLLIVSPNEINPIQPVIEEAYNKGIPVILIDRRIGSDLYTAYVGGDNYLIGKVAANYIANRLGNKGKIIEILGAMSMSPARERTNGFNDVLKQYPELINVKKIDTNWDGNIIFDSIPAILNRYPDVKAIYSFNDNTARDASRIVKKSLGDNKILIIGIDGLPNEEGGIQLVEEGIISATLIYPTGGKEAIQIASKILHKEPFKKENLLPTTIIDRSNVEITRLQFNNISALQSDIVKSKHMLEILDGRYKTQHVLLFVMAILLFLIGVLLVMYYSAFRKKKLANLNLERQKGEIEAQNVAIATQNNELKRMSNELEKVTQERLRFYTNISHEFRTPLTLISGPVNNLLKQKNITKEQSELLDIANKNISILLKLIEQIIDFRKYELGAHGFSPVHTGLKKHLLNWNELFKEVKSRKQINFHFDVPDENEFEFDFDVEKMERIYTNLLSNAFKFTPDKGTILVTLKERRGENQDSVVLEVANSGKQISQSDIQNIFDRFYQAGSKEGGSGIGLALVRAYVDLHHGKIDVSSEGGFVRFILILPKIQKAETVITEISNSEKFSKPQISAEPKDKAGIIEQLLVSDDQYIFDDHFDENETTILLVDDHPGIRSFLKSLLKDKYAVIEARDGIEGIRKAMKYIPDLIISDVMMPGIDGVELCIHLKKEFSTSHIPIILLTANTQDEKRIVGFESGADSYMTKPVNFEILEVRIRTLIEGRNKLRNLFTDNEKNKSQQSLKLPPIDKSFIDILQRKIEERISDTGLSVEGLSQELGLSRIQVYRKVKALTNYSPAEFITNIRLNQAIHLLTMTDKSMKEISEMVGCGSLASFSTIFKKKFGKTPSQYKKEIRNM
ncbi:MAG TPA: substrate-binding domain-containing protein [Prolixibacteraceae bacterium]|nr:substrate-binding domain-containing protein [Prolixibacteraceae bacterium]